MDSIRIDRLNILRRNPPSPGPDSDLERQQPPTMSTVQSSPVTTTSSPRPEMTERTTPSSSFLPRFPPLRRTTIPSFFSGSRRSSTADSPGRLQGHYSGQHYPSSSYYSDDSDDRGEVIDSPKTPRFSLNMPDLPSTRLHLPHLARTWTEGSSGPPSRPGTAQAWARGERFPIVAEPMPTMPPEYVGHGVAAPRGHRRGQESRTRFRGVDPAEMHLAELVEDSRRRRGVDRERRHHHRRHHHHRDGRRHGSNTRRGTGPGESRKAPPKHFLFCFPWVQSKRMRTQILKCFVSGMFLMLLLSVYLALSITKTINNSELTVLLILIILFTTIFFCHGLIRLCMLIVRGPRAEDERRAREQLPQMIGPGGYAVPRQPIRVVLARDEEAAGIESDATKSGPPAYGLWRESVRVDPNRIYWQRNEDLPRTPEDEDVPSPSDAGPTRQRSGSPRPPSYASDDGVSYVVEAQPRSVAPTTDVPLPVHPSEVGRVALRPLY